MQKSVFLGTLSANERDELALKCEELIDADVDILPYKKAKSRSNKNTPPMNSPSAMNEVIPNARPFAMMVAAVLCLFGC